MFSKIIVLETTLNWDDVTLIPFNAVDVIAVKLMSVDVTVDGYDILIRPPAGIPNAELISTWADPLALTNGVVGKMLKLVAVPAIAL